MESAVDSYKDTGYQMAEIFGVPKPQGSTFLFLDVSEYLDEEGVDGLLNVFVITSYWLRGIPLEQCITILYVFALHQHRQK